MSIGRMGASETRIGVVIADASERDATAARKALTADGFMNVLRVVGDRGGLLASVSGLAPEIVVLDGEIARGDAAALIREILSRAPTCCVILTASDSAPHTLSRAVVAGARGFLLKPYRPEELVVTCRDAFLNERQLRTASERREEERPEGGALIAVYSPKGGVGTTTIATSLAVALAAKAPDAVALVDLDLQFGDVGVVLDLKSPNTIADLLGHNGALDRATLDEVLLRRAGVSILLAPDDLGAAATLDPEKVVELLGALRAHFAYVVCDTWCNFEELTVATLAAADRVVVVTTPELPALRDVRRAMSEMPFLQLDRKGLLVANRYPSRGGLGIDDIETGLGKKVALTIPSEGITITQAINKGISALDPHARVKTSQSYVALADLVVSEVGVRTVRRVESVAAAVAS